MPRYPVYGKKGKVLFYMQAGSRMLFKYFTVQHVTDPHPMTVSAYFISDDAYDSSVRYWNAQSPDVMIGRIKGGDEITFKKGEPEGTADVTLPSVNRGQRYVRLGGFKRQVTVPSLKAVITAYRETANAMWRGFRWEGSVVPYIVWDEDGNLVAELPIVEEGDDYRDTA